MQTRPETTADVIQGEDEFKMSYMTGMSAAAIQILTEASTGTLRAHKSQSVRDPPHPNRICLKKDEDFCKTDLLLL